ncbi:glycosyltransferase family 4 protein [Corynebacterium lactis]|uniref:GDP-mannose-dependent alpha-(1-2)-phosphatidylinositol mannosyltransferase n=1 Tax=Corynebacterium lactis RW2-5 TaxID=1408189 RepID=A0A0K2H067_9CORY|nr:glycosyltransferase family 4 protein [Corynebacterium lactis]ALA67318.1 GDP-mannose-dependent alpha-(1-2)-phosphatidylinositol mannosyltransferase [Corynebacterium lactis RW2-5]
MRIGMVCPYSFDVPGGVQVHAIDLCEELISRGHEVSLIGPASEECELSDFVVKGGAAIPIPYNGSVARLSFGPRTRRKVRSWMQEGNFDVLHIHEPNSPSYSMLALANAVGPIVATYHSAATNSLALKLATPFLRRYLERIRGGIAVSEVARRWQVEQLGGDPVLVPNGVRVADYESTQPSTAFPEIPARRTGHPRIVFLGRFDEPRKGFDVLLGALPEIRHRFPQVEVCVVGDGDAEASRRKAGENASALRFLGRLSEEAKAAILGDCEAYIAPQRGGESFGIVLVEAMAAGAPVISSDIDAFRLVLDDGTYGLQFSNGKSSDLADAVIRLLEDEGLRSELRQRGHRRAWEYDWSTIADKVLQVYDTVRLDGERVVVTP